MGAVILQAAGTAIGSYFGPVGGAIGGLIGGAIGGAIFGQKNPTVRNVQQPLSDLRIVGTEYGQPIPILIGSHIMAGQIWWNSDRRMITTVTSETSGGGKGGGGGGQTTETTTRTYEADYLIGLVDHEITGGVARVFDNGKLVATFDIGASAESLAASASAETWDRITVYMGTNTQLPDPTYEAAIVAEGKRPCAYRDRAYVFIQGLKLGSSGSLRNLTFEVVADGTAQSETEAAEDAGITPVITSATAPSGADYFVTPNQGGPANAETAGYYGMLNSGLVWIHHIVAGDENVSLVNISTGAIVANFSDTDIPSTDLVIRGVDRYDGSCYVLGYVAPEPTNRIYKLRPDGTIEGYLKPTVDMGVNGVHGAFDGTSLWMNNFLDQKLVHAVGIDWSGHTLAVLEATGPSDDEEVVKYFLVNCLGIPDRVYYHNPSGIAYIDQPTLFAINVISPSPGTTFGQSPCLVGDDTNIYVTEQTVSPDSTDLKKYDQDGDLLATLTFPGKLYCASLYDSSGHVWLKGPISSVANAEVVKVDPVSMTVVATIPNTGPVAGGAGGVGGGNYFGAIAEPTLGTIAFYLDIGGIGIIGASFPTVEKLCVTVEEAQSRLCLHSGLDASQFDVTALAAITQDVCCLPISQVTAMRTPSELLMGNFFYVAIVSNKIYFRPLGGSPVASIPYSDLGATVGDDMPEPLELQLGSDLELPAQRAITYINIDNDYQPDTQYSDRLISAVAGTVDAVDMAIGRHASETKAVADTTLLSQLISLLTTSISLLGKYCRLEPGDSVLVTYKDGSVLRLRFTQKTDSYPLLGFNAVLDDPSILSSQGITSTDFSPQTVVRAAVATLMQLLDLPILQDGDDNSGFYVVVKGDGTPYPGSQVFDSEDKALTAQIREIAVFGTCVTALGDWTGPRVFDETNILRVNVGDATLSSSTRDAVLADQAVNAFAIGTEEGGYELIQAVTAALVSPGVYDLSLLLRGGRGTEWAMTGHVAGEDCVLLRAFGMRRIVLSNSQLGISRFYKGVTLGRPISSGTAEAFTCNAVGLKPFSPVDLRISRDASNNITGTFKRRTRLSTRLVGELGISVPLGEETEAYAIDVFSDDTYTTVVRTISVSTAAFSYSAAAQSADGLTPGDPVAFHIQMISATVGRGYELEMAA